MAAGVALRPPPRGGGGGGFVLPAGSAWRPGGRVRSRRAAAREEKAARMVCYEASVHEPWCPRVILPVRSGVTAVAFD